MSICQDISDSDTERRSHEYAERSVAVYAWSLVKRGLGRGVCTSCLTSPIDQDPLLEIEARSHSDPAMGVTSGELDAVDSTFGRRRDTQQRSCWPRGGRESAVTRIPAATVFVFTFAVRLCDKARRYNVQRLQGETPQTGRATLCCRYKCCHFSLSRNEAPNRVWVVFKNLVKECGNTLSERPFKQHLLP